MVVAPPSLSASLDVYQVCFGNIHVVLHSISLLPSFLSLSLVCPFVRYFICNADSMYFEWMKEGKKTYNLYVLTLQWIRMAAVSRSILFFFFFPFLFMNTIIRFDLEMALIVRLSIPMLYIYVNVVHIHTASFAIDDRIGTCCLPSTKCPFMQMILNLIYCCRCCCSCCYCLNTLPPNLIFLYWKVVRERESEKHPNKFYTISNDTIFEFFFFPFIQYCFFPSFFFNTTFVRKKKPGMSW